MMIMDYYPLHNLEREAIRQGFTATDVKTLLHQGLQALVYLHYEDTVHRDIKPQNILVKSREPHFVIALADFGLASSAGSSYLKTYCGTYRYITPEVFDGKYWDAVDIWSLGVVALQYLHGLPMSSEYERGYADEVAERATTLAGTYPSDELILLLNRMLQMDPKNRPTAAQCLSLLEDFKDGHTEDAMIAKPTEDVSSSNHEGTFNINPKDSVSEKRARSDSRSCSESPADKRPSRRRRPTLNSPAVSLDPTQGSDRMREKRRRASSQSSSETSPERKKSRYQSIEPTHPSALLDQRQSPAHSVSDHPNESQ